MFKNLNFKIFLFITTLTLSVGAVGVVATGHSNGGYLPKSDDLITWSAYGAALSGTNMRDILTSATLSVDLETDSFRLVHDAHPEFSLHHVFFSFKGGEPNAKCLDDTPGGCTLGKNECLIWEQVGPYRLCSQNRVLIYVPNIRASAEKSGDNFDEKLFRVIRHEWVHPLGFPDGAGGLTTNSGDKFTECQLAQLRVYDVDELSPEWSAVSPTECD